MAKNLHDAFDAEEDFVDETASPQEAAAPVSMPIEEMEKPLTLDEKLRQIGRGGMAGLESIGRGASLGFADEAAAALGAAIEQRHGERPFSEIYQDILKYTKGHEAQQKQEFPKTTLAGELVGAAAIPVAGPETVAGKLALGGTLGGVGAAGMSEAPVMSGEFAQDVGIGTALGAGIGGVPALAKETAIGTKNLAKSIGHIEDIMEMFKRGKMGQALVGREARSSVGGELAEASKDITSKLRLEKLLSESPESIQSGIKSLGLEKVSSSEQAIKKLMPFMQTLGGESKSADVAKMVLKETENYLRKANPKLAEEIIPQMQELARKYNLVHKTTRESIAPGLGGQILGPLRALGLSGANIAGRGIKKISEMPPEQLSQLSSKLNQRFGRPATKLLTVLDKLADTATSQQSKNALIFAALQDPANRQMLREIEPDEFEQEENFSSQQTPKLDENEQVFDEESEE